MAQKCKPQTEAFSASLAFTSQLELTAVTCRAKLMRRVSLTCTPLDKNIKLPRDYIWKLAYGYNRTRVLFTDMCCLLYLNNNNNTIVGSSVAKGDLSK